MSELPKTLAVGIYALTYTIHVYCATTFVSGAFFEMLILSVLYTGRISRELRCEVECAIPYRAVRVMPPVVITLFVSDIAMVYNRYPPILYHPFDNSFGIMLSIKILLAVSVLVHFVIAIVKIVRRTLTVGWSKYIRTVVFGHILLIVFFAKAMFHLSW